MTDIDQRALDSLSSGDSGRDPRQDAGQDKSIAQAAEEEPREQGRAARQRARRVDGRERSAFVDPAGHPAPSRREVVGLRRGCRSGTLQRKAGVTSRLLPALRASASRDRPGLTCCRKASLRRQIASSLRSVRRKPCCSATAFMIACEYGATSALRRSLTIPAHQSAGSLGGRGDDMGARMKPAKAR